jgi:hypothetical protein
LTSIHSIDDLSQYEVLLAAFENSRSLAAENARERYQGLSDLSHSLDVASFAMLRSILDSRRSASAHRPPTE